MKPTPAAVAVALVAALVIVVLATVGAPFSRPAPVPAPASSPSADAVSANGIALASQEIALPDADAPYPDGPHADVVNANCTGCHSPSMALTQPKLSADQWQAEVTKMREVYKAPVPDAAVADIVAYLTSLPTQRPGPGPTHG